LVEVIVHKFKVNNLKFDSGQLWYKILQIFMDFDLFEVYQRWTITA